LCIVRNCYQMNLDTISQLFFPDRGAGAVLARYNPLLNSTKDYWDQADDEKILGLYQQQREEFEKFAAVDFQGQFSAFDLEKAYGAAWRTKFTPTGNLKKPKPKKSEAGEKSKAGLVWQIMLGRGRGRGRSDSLRGKRRRTILSRWQYSNLHLNHNTHSRVSHCSARCCRSSRLYNHQASSLVRSLPHSVPPSHHLSDTCSLCASIFRPPSNVQCTSSACKRFLAVVDRTAGFQRWLLRCSPDGDLYYVKRAAA
jgi:hypothetical protein